MTKETYTKIKESEVAQKVGSGLSKVFEKTKENVQNPDLLKENVKKAYEGAKESINKGIEKVKDPEYRNEVKEGFKSRMEKVKKSTGEFMDNVGNRFIDPPPEGFNRADYDNLDKEGASRDSPFDIMSDDEEEEVEPKPENDYRVSEVKESKERKTEKNDRETLEEKEEEEEVPLISEVPARPSEEVKPQPLD